ncbi:MAG: tetraacyldisaccharide 4'-kinase [Sphingobacteriia bacterium]|jgi:tetraacyldisaccharide 4'-kinase|nr:MAG: tetraacyldisaccharide 4'-kinase [Sphingobacteriia bacterium]
MHFNAFFLKSFRVLLLPLAVLYGGVIWLRNLAFDKKWLGSARFHFPLICVGNLAVGGTGKSPMVEYILERLLPHVAVGTLSRGYKRKTKGYLLAGENTTALEIGDEPMQFHLKFPQAAIAVGEERLVAIPQLLQDRPDLKAIILDDAFQHRSVQAGLNILLTEFSNLYSDDFFLPTGDLRDQWSSAKRAAIIIVTKCPTELSEAERQSVLASLKPLAHQKVFFSTIDYGTPYHLSDPQQKRDINLQDEVLLVCGIANPQPLKTYLHQKAQTYYQLDFRDHHIFSVDDLRQIKKQFDQISAPHKMILTTEKDAVRLHKFKEEISASDAFYVLPIRHRILFDQAAALDKYLLDFVLQFPLSPTHE